MNRLWNSVIKPIIEAINIDYIVEVGSEKGINTQNILEYCMEYNAHMTTIDPLPNFDVDEFKAKYGDKFEIYAELSLSRLPLLDNYGAILLDGDHNWYTTYNELKIIEKKFNKKKFPVVFLHDVGWPYARRDLYYNPENIPEVFRQPYKKLGMRPNHPNLEDKGGLNVGYNNAIYENNPNNGVLTAVEDFIYESNIEFSLEIINAFNGLGILFPKNEKIEKIVKKIIKNADLVANLEDKRIRLLISYSESEKQIKKLRDKLNKLDEEKNTLLTDINESKNHNKLVEEKLDKLENERNNLLTDFNDFKNQNKLLEEKLTKLKEEKNTLITAKYGIKGRNKLLEYQLDEKKIKLDKIEKNLAKLEEEKTKFRTLYVKSKGRNNFVENKLKELEDKRTDVTIAYTKSKGLNKSLENKLDKLKDEKKNLSISLNELNAQNKIFEDKLNEFKAEKGKLNNAYNESKNKVKYLKNKLYQNKVKLEKTESKLIKFEKENKELKNKLEPISVRNELKEELVKLKTVYYESESQNELLENKLKEETSKLRYTESKLNSSLSQIKEKESIIKSIEKKEEKLNQEIQEITANFYEMEYLASKNRSFNKRLISMFPSLYILFKGNNNGIKNAFINIKGYSAIKENDLLNISYYLKNNPDLRSSGMDPILHYIYYGFKEGKKPNPSFDGDYYLRTHGDTRNLNPLVHYSLYGINEGRKTIDDQKIVEIQPEEVKSIVVEKPKEEIKIKKISEDELNKQQMLIFNSELFDLNWYKEQYNYIDFTKIDPVRHYLEIGANKGHDPSPFFDTDWYLENNPDVARAKINPFIHYIQHGAAERRDPNPSFDSLWYVEQFNPPLPCEINPLFHYINEGVKNGLATYPHFSIDDPANKSIRTLFFSHDLKMQGAQNSLYEMITGLKNKKIVNPVVYSPSDGPLRTAYEKNDIKVIIGNRKLQDPISLEDFNESFSLLLNKLEKYNFQFIHSNTLRTFYGIEIARKMNIPCTWNPRESEPWETYYDYLPEKIRKIALNCFNYPYKVIFVSNYTKEIWEHLDNNNFTTIHNALNTERLTYNSANWTKEEARTALGIKEKEIAIVAVGTITERKGQKDIIHAVNKLPTEIIDKVKIFLVGDKPSQYSEELHALRSELPPQLRESIFIIPETTQENEFFKVVDYYMAADILVFSSRIESYPRVILEAIYFNLPIITTPVFGVKEQVEDGVSALFYEPGDIDQLTNQLLKLLKDEDLRYKLRENIKKRSEELSTHEEMLDKYGEIISEGYLKNK